jgi:hypothetical protein
LEHGGDQSKEKELEEAEQYATADVHSCPGGRHGRFFCSKGLLEMLLL